ncbi:hypothetical protein F5I97DRAFT_1931248 [Phlebopus sp. FC_14]|nr:hypothetical protein F5I97DRAFT_1931248 [Phlebopus sp. FC_14]
MLVPELVLAAAAVECSFYEDGRFPFIPRVAVFSSAIHRMSTCTAPGIYHAHFGLVQFIVPQQDTTTMAAFPVTTAQIVALFMECILYGVHLVTLAQCLRSLLWSDVENRLKRKINWRMLTVALLMGLIATLDVAFGLRHNLDAFVYYTGPGGPTTEFAMISNWVNVMKTVDYIVQNIIGDGMLIYVVYDRKWYYVAPSLLLWLAGSSCGVLVIVVFATLDAEIFLDASQAKPYVYSTFALTMTLNILTTLLIVYRIWSVDRQTAHTRVDIYGAPRLRFIARILIESATLYTLSVFVSFGTYIANSSANYGASYNVVQLTGICFNLVIIRADSGRAYDGTTSHTPMRLPLSTFRAFSVGSLATADRPPLDITVRQEFSHDGKCSLGELEL